MEEIQKLPHPHGGKELQPVVGMLNFVQKFAPDLADGTGSLHELLKKDIQWTWGSTRERAFVHLKEHLSLPPVLAQYIPDRPTKASADASSYRLRAVLLQKEGA